MAVAPVAGTTDYRVLQARRSELSRQLSSAEGRREDVLKELSQAPTGAARVGIEARLTLLDQRILQIETDIAANGQALAANPRSAGADAGTGASTGGFRFNNDVLAPAGIIFSLFVLAPLAFAMARRIWRGVPAPMRRDPESDARLERIEQAVDAIAIEIERVSEAQRFQAKLLGEGSTVPVFGKAREAIGVGLRGHGEGEPS